MRRGRAYFTRLKYQNQDAHLHQSECHCGPLVNSYPNHHSLIEFAPYEPLEDSKHCLLAAVFSSTIANASDAGAAHALVPATRITDHPLELHQQISAVVYGFKSISYSLLPWRCHTASGCWRIVIVLTVFCRCSPLIIDIWQHERGSAHLTELRWVGATAMTIPEIPSGRRRGTPAGVVGTAA